MKFALCNEMLMKWSLENQFEAIAAWGYDGVELAPFSVDPAFASGASPTATVERIDASLRRRIVATAKANGIAVSGLHWILAKTEGFGLTTPDAEVRRATAAYLAKLVDLCADLGGTYLVLGSPAQRNVPQGLAYSAAEANALETIESILPNLEKSGVVLALEALAPSETNFWTTAAETLGFIDKLGAPPTVTLHLDCKAMTGGESAPIPEVVKASCLGRRTPPTFHANDPNLRGPGFGELDFRPIFGALADVGFDGWIGVEPFDYSPGVVELGRESLLYLKSCATSAK